MPTDSERFDEKLAEILDKNPASHLLSIPGVYEVVSEHFNNDVLAALCSHENQDVNERSQFVCRDCGEELGR